MVADEIEISTAPRVKVIQNGREVDTSAIDNYDQFMGFLMQASMAANMAQIKKYYDDRSSVGGVQNWELQLRPTPLEVTCHRPCQSIYVVNDGPGDIYVVENSLERTPARLHIHDEMFNNFELHKLLCFYIWSATGTEATARIKVKY
jgi:hypothetical protein